MKTTIIPLFVASIVLLIALPAAAQRPDRGPDWKKVLEKFDKDGDGKLNEVEFRALIEARRQRRASRARGGGAGPSERRGSIRKKMLEKFDKDGDGKLNDDERSAMRKAWLEKYDKDGDGKLSDDERSAMRKAWQERRAKDGSKHRDGKGKGHGHGSRHGDFADRMIARLDKNKDGKLSAEEYLERYRKNFGKADANNDGFVGKDELKARLKEVRKQHGHKHKYAHGKWKGKGHGHAHGHGSRHGDFAGRMIARLDKNEDGKLSAEEYPERYRKNFGKADANNDGFVGKDELKARLKEVRKQRHSRSKTG